MSKAVEQYNMIWFVIVACGGHVREPTVIRTLHLGYMDSTFYLMCFCPLPCPFLETKFCNIPKVCLFRRVCKIFKSDYFLMSIRLSVPPHGTTRLLPEGFSKSEYYIFPKSVENNQV
jgi:hypothetical protein